MKRKWILGAILVLLLIFALSRINGESLLYSISQIPLWLVLFMIVMQIVSQLLVNLQWYKIAKLANTPISFRDMLYVNSQGSVMDSITPGVKIGGEITRAVQISRVTKCPSEQSAAVVFVQKIFSISALFLIMLFAVSWFLALPFLAILLCAFFAPGRIRKYLQAKKDPSFAWARKAKGFLCETLNQMCCIRKNTGSLIVLSMLSLSIWLLYPAKMYILAVQFYPDAHIVHITAITFAAYAVAMLPIFPGGLGGFEGTMAGLLAAMGVAVSDAAVMTIYFRFATFWFVLLVSLVYIALYKICKSRRLCQWQ